MLPQTHVSLQKELLLEMKLELKGLERFCDVSTKKQSIVYHKKQVPPHSKHLCINVFTCSLKVQIREM